MARPMELADLLAVVRLTRGGCPRPTLAPSGAAAEAAGPVTATGANSGGESSEDGRQGGRKSKWGWPSKALFKRQGPGRAPTHEGEASTSEVETEPQAERGD